MSSYLLVYRESREARRADTRLAALFMVPVVPAAHVLFQAARNRRCGASSRARIHIRAGLREIFRMSGTWRNRVFITLVTFGLIDICDHRKAKDSRSSREIQRCQNKSISKNHGKNIQGRKIDKHHMRFWNSLKRRDETSERTSAISAYRSRELRADELEARAWTNAWRFVAIADIDRAHIWSGKQGSPHRPVIQTPQHPNKEFIMAMMTAANFLDISDTPIIQARYPLGNRSVRYHTHCLRCAFSSEAR